MQIRKLLTLTLLLFTLGSFAQKQIYIPRSFNSNPDIDWSWERTYESENFIIFWGPDLGENPLTGDSDITFDPKVVTDYLEGIYRIYIDDHKFIEEVDSLAKYKIIVVMNETWGPNVFTGWAFGGSYDDVIAAMWVHPRAATNDGWVLAHELTHSFQGQNYIQTNTDGGGFIGDNKVGFFWECHANFMATHIYPENASTDLPRWMATRSFHWSSTRHHYVSFRMLYTVEELLGIEAVNDLWHHSNPGEVPLAALKRLQGWSQEELNDFMWEYARREPNADYPLYGWGEDIRAERRRIKNEDPALWWRMYTILERTGNIPGRYIVPEYAAPQDYGINLIPLYPDYGEESIRIRFKGHTEANPYTGWRYGVVAVKDDGTTRYGNMQASPESEFDYVMQGDEKEWYLVVMGTPSVINEYPWEIGYPKIYRNPYEVRIINARPYGYQQTFRQEFKKGGTRHNNGGGWVASSATVSSEAYVGPKAMVMGNSNIGAGAKIEDFAWVQDATLSQQPVIRGRAKVVGGSYSGRVVVEDYAVLNYVNGSGSAEIGGMALAWNANYGGRVVIGGDAEMGTCTSSGIYLQTPHPENQRTPCDQHGEDHWSNQEVNEPYTPFADEEMLFAGEEMPIVGNVKAGYDISITPNPVMQQLTVRSEQQLKGIYIRNTAGQIIISYENVLLSPAQFDLSSLEPGLYIIELLTGDDEHLTSQLIKK